MRPPEFTGGNQDLDHTTTHNFIASMRPPEFTGGNLRSERDLQVRPVASMRPPEFTGGNPPSLGQGGQSVIVLQ